MTDQTATPNVPARFDANAAIARFTHTEAELTALAEKHVKEVFDVSTAKGLAVAKEVRKTFRDLRLNIEETRADAKRDALEYGRALDSHAKKLQAIIADAEKNADDQIKAEEKRQREEREASERAEAEKIARENALLDSLRDAPLAVITAPVADIETAIERVNATSLDELTGHALERAVMLKASALQKLESILAGAKAQAAERARRAEEDAKREAEEKRQAEEKAAQERQEREKRDREDQERRKADEAAQERQRIAMSQIQGIQHQVIIARSGRQGVRRGGTRECIADTLAETEAWELSEDEFGSLLGMARQAKETAVQQIRDMLEQWDLRVEQERESKRLADEQKRIRDEAAEQDRLRQEREARERQEAEQARIQKLAADAPPLRQAAINALSLLSAKGLAGTDEAIQLKAAIEADAGVPKPRGRKKASP